MWYVLFERHKWCVIFRFNFSNLHKPNEESMLLMVILAQSSIEPFDSVEKKRGKLVAFLSRLYECGCVIIGVILVFYGHRQRKLRKLTQFIA